MKKSEIGQNIWNNSFQSLHKRSSCHEPWAKKDTWREPYEFSNFCQEARSALWSTDRCIGDLCGLAEWRQETGIQKPRWMEVLWKMFYYEKNKHRKRTQNSRHLDWGQGLKERERLISVSEWKKRLKRENYMKEKKYII